MAKKKRKEFTPPTDITKWWKAPHCGPGSVDDTDECGFCGEPVIDCALEASKIVNDEHRQPGDGDYGEGCGGSGFWCYGCNRFWAQDSCGNNDYESHRASDGAELVLNDDTGFVYCPCGRQLMQYPEEYSRNKER
jgi:hypothetical protein